MKRQQNIPNADGSLTLCNAAVQRLLDYGVLHCTDEGFYVGKWPQTNTPTRDSDTRPKDGDAPESAAPLASSAVAKPIAQPKLYPPSRGSSHA